MPAHQQVVVSPRQARVEPPQQDPERQHLNAAQPRTFDSTNTPSPEIVVQNGATLITEGAHKAVTTPLPYLPIVALAVGRVAEGLMYSVCFPYINKLISELGVRDEDVGKWSAAAEGAPFIAATFSGPVFGYLGDRFGRKPVYLACIVGWMMCACAFGMSESLVAIILSRSVCGILSGPGVLSRTIMAEITDSTNAVKAFALFSPALAIGSSLGPVLGGLLARPVPNLLSDKWVIFARFPYLLPAMAVSSTALIVLVMVAIIVPETRSENLRAKYSRPSKRGYTVVHSAAGDNERASLSSGTREAGESEGSERKRSDLATLFSHRPCLVMLLSYAVTSPNIMAFQTVFPLFAYTPTGLGGLNLSVRATGWILGCAAVLGVSMTVFVFPPLYARLGAATCLLLCIACYTMATLAFPSLLILHHGDARDHLSASTILMLFVHFGLRLVGDFSGTNLECTRLMFRLLDALVRPSLPSPDLLATANAIVCSIRQVARAVGVYLIALVFSFSARAPAGTVGRQLWWILFAAANLPGLYLVFVTQVRKA